MVAMMMVTFLLLFAFVVNTGMLVHAKINLQNAADLAAYSGASVQARQLNAISFLNYEMRRAYKKFLFRYYIIGNLSLPPSSSGGGGGTRTYAIREGGSLRDIGGPSVCIIFNVNDNVCQNATINPISIPAASPIDVLQTTLREQLMQIENIRQQNCKRTGATNFLTTYMWLMNTDPDGSRIAETVRAITGSSNPEIGQILPLIRGLSSGLGIIANNTLLKLRIKTVADYINTTPQTKMTFEKVQALREAEDPMRHERTIQAFVSAYETLGENTFDGEIVMDELMPTGASGADLIALNEIKTPTGMALRYAVLDVVPSGAGGNEASCNRTEASLIPEPFIVGMSKVPSTLTYYALRLQADAKLMFNPFGGSLRLTAYSAAMPFGSRIGPATTSGEFASGVNPSLALGPGVGFDQISTVGTLTGKMNELTGIGTGSATNAEGRITPQTFERMYQVAMAPNESELGRYNIPHDQSQDPFMEYFPASEGSIGTYAFWAPLQPDDKQGEDPNALANAFLAGLSNSGDSQENAAKMDGNVQSAFRDAFNEYVAELREGKSPTGESFHTYRMANPLLISTDAGPQSAALGGVSVSDGGQLNTSFADVRDSEIAAKGRTGYSVKFISFDSLVGKKVSTNGNTTMNNPPVELDGTVEADLKMMRH